MKLQELTLKNINSFGNKIQTLKFEDKSQLILLYGDNGVGKTTVSDALSLSLYGSVAKRKLSKIPNRFNKGLEVSTKFVTSDDIPVHITRGLAPRKYNLEIDGVSENTSIDDVNNRLENELIKIPYGVFTNSVLLRLSEFESFVKMKVDKKRKIVDKIFESDIVNNMFTEFKEHKRDTNDEVEGLVKSRDAIEAKIESSVAILSDLKTRINVDDFNLDEKTKEKNIKSTYLDKLTSEIAQLVLNWNNRVNEINSYISSCDMQLQTLSNTHTQSLTELNTNYNQKYTDYNTTIYDTVKLEYDKEILKINKELTETNSKITKYSSELVIEKEELLKVYKVNYTTKYTDNKTAEVTRINLEISKLQNTQVSLKTQLQQIIDLIEQSNVANIEFNQQLIAIGVNVTNTNNKITLFEKGSCPECESDLSDHKGHAKLEDYKKSLSHFQIGTDNIKKSILNNNIIVDVEIPKKLKLELQINEIANLISLLQIEYNNLDTTISNKLSEYHIAEIKKIDDIISSKSDTFKSNQSESMQIKNNRLQEISELIRIAVETKTSEFKLKNDIDRQAELIESATQYNTDVEIAQKSKDGWLSTKTLEDGAHTLKKDNLTTTQSMNQRQLDAIESEISRYLEETQLLKDAETIIDTYQIELNEFEKQLEEHVKLQSIQDIVSNLLGEEGIKQQIIKHSLPAFNHSIDYFRNYLEYPYYFKFDENFDVEISQYSFDIDPSELSMGETRLMDLIIILSVFDLILTKKHNLNVIFLDEIFTSLSKRNINKVTHLLKEYSQKYNINVIIVSHTEVPMEYFDKVYELYKDGDFSDMKEIK